MATENSDTPAGTSKPKRVSKRGNRSGKTKKPSNREPTGRRPFPRVSLETAIKVAVAIREQNGGNPWNPQDLAAVFKLSSKTTKFFYITSASKDFGLTTGTRDSAEITLTELGKELVYAASDESEREARMKAFSNVPIFRDVLAYYNGSALPEMKFLKNTLENKFRLAPEYHEEFAVLFQENCDFLGISSNNSAVVIGDVHSDSQRTQSHAFGSEFVTIAEPDKATNLLCFVAMPFSEKTEKYPAGFFHEVLKQLIAPAARAAGFKVVTARQQGSDVIHSTIINGLIDADLVVVDLTEHNPNVLFELGFRLCEDKPVALIRATGTTPIFDVDNLLRVESYNPCLWPSTVEADLPKLRSHIEGAWTNRSSQMTYKNILRDKRRASGSA